MARTKRNAMLIEEARQKIRTTQLINRLMNHAEGKIEMSPTQVRAVEILLSKTLPNLQAVEATVDGDMVQRVVSDKPMAEDEWTKRYGDSLAAPAGTPESIN